MTFTLKKKQQQQNWRVCLTHKGTTQYLEKLLIHFVSGYVTPVLMYDFPLFTTHL